MHIVHLPGSHGRSGQPCRLRWLAMLPLVGLLGSLPVLAGADGGKAKNAQYNARWRPETPLLRDLPVGTVVQTHITKIELYPGGALIERAGTAVLGPGEARLVVPSLPDALQVNSLQISGFGKEAVAGSTLLEAGTMVEARPKELVDLESGRDQLERQDQVLGQREEALQQRLELLTTNATQAGGSGGITPEALNKMLDFAFQERLRVTMELGKVQDERATLQPKLEALRKDHEALKARLQRPVKHVVIEVTAATRVKIPLIVRYFVHGPSWRPRHVVRYEPATGQLSVATQAWCLQDTGEDWSDVQLAVSTARLAAGLEAPVVQPLEVWTDKLDEGVRARESQAVGEHSGPRIGLPSAGPQRFELGKATVPSGERGRKVALDAAVAPAAAERLAVPRADKGVYLTLQWKNPRQSAVLPGEAALLYGSDYVGTATLPAIHPGEVLTLPFGRDPQFSVIRQRIVRESENSARSVTLHQRFSYALLNESRTAASVEVRDQLPTARDRSVKVSQDPGGLTSVPGGKELPTGTVIWRIDVAPGAPKSWEFGWSVVAPAGTRVLGVD